MYFESINVEEIIDEIKVLEDLATNMKYDGWTQNENRRKLIKLKETLKNLKPEVFELHEE
jgi:hypothetical protein